MVHSLLRKGWLVALALGAAVFVAALGSGISGVREAHALEGDICQVAVGGPGGQLELLDDPDVGGGGFDGQGNQVFVVSRGTTYGLLFRIEDGYWENVEVRIDSETGSARITSKAEITDVDEFGRQLPDDGDAGDDNFPDTNISEDFDSDEIPYLYFVQYVYHALVTPPVLTQVVDVMVPETDDYDGVDFLDHFVDSDGNPVNGISGWLADVGYAPLAADIDDDTDVCGDSYDDGWGFIDFECIEAGYFHIDVLTPDDTEETGQTLKFYCGGQAETATIAVSPATVETDPVGSSKGESTVTVTVEDQFGDRIDGIYVTLTTDNCTFKGDGFISPAGGGKTVDVMSDTDTAGATGTKDQNFLADNPLEHSAGTAEAILDCDGPGPKGTPGTAHITAVVQRPGADIVLSATVTVVGSTSTSGLTLTLSPDDLECGETITATATAVDSTGANVSDGTLIYFTTDTSSGVVGGSEGAQGGIATVGGKASVLIATDPSNPGTHTVIAYAIRDDDEDSDFDIVAQTSATYTCDAAVAPAVPGSGTGSITPPSTGDGGLASSHGGGLLIIAGVMAVVAAAISRLRVARS